VFTTGNFIMVHHYVLPLQHHAAISMEVSMSLSKLWYYYLISQQK